MFPLTGFTLSTNSKERNQCDAEKRFPARNPSGYSLEQPALVIKGIVLAALLAAASGCSFNGRYSTCLVITHSIAGEPKPVTTTENTPLHSAKEKLNSIIK